jgi:protein-tyrosine-phosphatase
MAEGWTRHLTSEVIAAYSAGIEKPGMKPHAVQVMAEAGVDLSKHSSQTLEDLKGVMFDYVVTVCGHAHEHCPVFPRPRSQGIFLMEKRNWRSIGACGMRSGGLSKRCRRRSIVEDLNTRVVNSERSMHAETIRDQVREGYTKIARDTSTGCCSAGVSCCGSAPQEAAQLARQLGYSADEL